MGPAAITVAGKVMWHHAASPIAGTLPSLHLHRQPHFYAKATSTHFYAKGKELISMRAGDSFAVV
jgi:hypothetical protein